MDRTRLSEHGWKTRDPLDTVADPWAYRAYIQRSAAEFSVAKQAYVASRSGWFSERSAAYLASGRPVVTQETGFSTWLPSVEGVVSFSTPDEAVAAVGDVRGRYDVHARRAREVAEEYFDSRTVLTSLVDRALSSTTARSEPPAVTA